MYSMNRRMTPVSRAQAAIGTMLDSLTPRRTTMLTLTGARPASMAAAIPSRTRSTGKSIPFIAPNTASSSKSRRDRHPSQPGGRERAGERAQRGTVGGERQVDLAAVGPSQGGQHPDERRQVTPDQRLAAGDAQLLHAQSDEHARDPLDLLEGEDLVLGQELVVAAEHFLGHAIRASEVASIGHRDAQVAHGAAHRVAETWTAVERGRELHRRIVARRPANGPGAIIWRSAATPRLAPRSRPPAGTTGSHRWYL